ncbi:MAG: hypothetical protein MRJ67_01325 [Nitrospirales bacterium]|nr:hypothetical protein [Nitrospira sp.]MDR4459160.1 hypothetical protein [Nitrospirales bacterium]MDR4483482.1 hypothetical protein [Nitrospirales bacterium]
MKFLMPVVTIFLITLSSVFALQAEVIVEKQGEVEEAMALEHRHESRRAGKAPMRIEEPDGTLQPLPSGSIPESRMSMEGLRDVPDAGGGTMVNVEGRFQSILKVPDGADHAIHHHDPEDLQPLKP